MRDLARGEGNEVESVELVGLVPQAAMRACSAGFLTWSGLDPAATIEDRLAAATHGTTAAEAAGPDRV